MTTSTIGQGGVSSGAAGSADLPPVADLAAGRRSAPAEPQLPGLDRVPYLTLATVGDVDRVPDHVIILGEGGAGVALGRRFRRAGGKVTIVQRGAQLPGDASDAAAGGTPVAERLRREG